MKEFVANKIYIDEIPLRFLGMQLGTRMTVIRMKNNILFLHSPTILTPDLKKQLDELGEVSIIVCPNKLHHLYVNSYVDNYPNAKIYAAPGLEKKEKTFNLTERYWMNPTRNGMRKLIKWFLEDVFL